MDIGNFLQLQGSLECYGITVAAAQVEAVVCIGEDLGHLGNLLVCLQRLFHFLGYGHQFPHHLDIFILGNRSTRLGQSQRQHGQHRHLPRERLCRSHADFRPHMDVSPGMRGPGDGGPHGITDTEHKSPLLACQFDGGQRVGRLAGLRYGNHYVGRQNDRIAVAELRRIFHIHGNTAIILDKLLADKPRVPRRTARHDDETARAQQLVLMVDDRRKRHVVGIYIDTPAHAIKQAIRLFENLLEHKIRIASLFQLAEVDVHRFHRRVHARVVHIHHFQLVSGTDDGDVSVFQIHHLVGVFHNRGGIRGQIKLIVAPDAHHQRTALACGNDLFGMPFVQYRDGVGTDDLM